MAPPLVLKADFERTAREWFKSWAGFIDWDTKPIQVEMSGDVAFVSALEHMEGRRVDGEDTDLWFRTTLGLRKVDGEWKIVHEHQSVPFAMDGSLKAAVDLKPDQLDDESSIPLAPSGDRSGLH
jgi:PhnB protein